MTTNSTASSNWHTGVPLSRQGDGNIAGFERRAGGVHFAGVTPWLGHGGHLARLLEREGGRQQVRSDDDVLCACLQALSWNAGVPEGAVHLDVHQGNVTLTGTVRLPHERAAAEMAILDVDGVVSISNLVCLAPAVVGMDIADRIRAAVSRTARRGDSMVEARVDGACVLLAGQVGSRDEHAAAVTAAWSAPGVAHVIDEIVVHS